MPDSPASPLAASSKVRWTEFRARRGKPAPAADGNPAVAARPEKDLRRKYLHEYFRWLWPRRIALGAVFALAVATASMDLIWPLAIKFVIDGGWRRHAAGGALEDWHQSLGRLNLIGFAIVALLVVKQSADILRNYRTAVLDNKVVVRLRRRLFDKLLRLSINDLSELKTGGIVSRLGSDVDQLAGLVQTAVISPSVAVLRVVLTVAILLALSWRLALAAAVLIPPMGILSYLWLKKVRPIYRSAQEDRTNIDARTSETFGGIRVVRAFRREPRESRSYTVGRHTVVRKSLHAVRMEMVVEAAWGFLIPVTSWVIVWFGSYLVLRGQAKPGDLFAFQIYAVLLLQPVWAIVSSVSQTQKSLAAMERVFEVLGKAPDKPDASDAIDAPPVIDEIRFDRVNFEYRPGVPVLRDFSLVVPGGSTVALVGASGAGKTTLTDLVARFHDPTSGAILLNGIDLRHIRLTSYRKRLAIVQQETFLFDGSVRENIAYGRRGASDAQIAAAARRANAHDFIAALPEGYDTLIGERGFKLSGGQKQRLSIARAILADPQLLILDEATSNLDTESELLIQASLAELFQSRGKGGVNGGGAGDGRGRTTFVIAHRLSTITHADLIVVLEAGRLVEVGTHEVLMSAGGSYAKMVERQQRAGLASDAVAMIGE